MTALLSVVAGITLLVAFIWIIVVNGVPADTWHTSGFSWVGFMATLSVAALWQIAYAPYVSDYTRYMPKDTGQRAAFWGTYTGCVLGSVLPMLLGVLVGAALPTDDTLEGLSALTHGVSTGVFAIFAVGITATNAMNLYCGTLSTITIGQNIFPRWTPMAMSRAVTAVVLFAITLVPALVSADDFLANYANFLALLLCVLIPWTAVNLVDYYVLRHGHYDISALFERDGGRYGRFNWVAIGCYLRGHPGPDPVPVHHAVHRFRRQGHRRGGHLVDRRTRRHLPALLRADAPAGDGHVLRHPQLAEVDEDHGVTVADYLVVGGGTAGCIVAARLSEDPGVTVTVIEPGPSDEHEPRARDIRRWAEMLEGEYDLDYRSVAQQRGNSHIRQARMRILGGCSTANTMITWRPLPADLDEWVALGATGWDAATVGPYFDRLAAPINPVADGDRNPFVADVVESACVALDLPRRTHWNSDPEFAETGTGAGFFEIGYTPADHLRSSTSVHYLHDALRTRPNLTVRHGEQAIRILVEDGAAVGVLTRDDGRLDDANSGRAAR